VLVTLFWLGNVCVSEGVIHSVKTMHSHSGNLFMNKSLLRSLSIIVHSGVRIGLCCGL